MTNKLAVIGSREGISKKIIYEELDKLFFDELISGGAKGVDTFAEQYAKDNNWKIEIIRPIDVTNKMSYLFRNIEIITKATQVIAFWNGKSKGTKFVINYCQKRNKKIIIINIK